MVMQGDREIVYDLYDLLQIAEHNSTGDNPLIDMWIFNISKQEHRIGR